MVVDTTYYEILQVEVTANEQELRKAYRKQAIKLHPDKNGNDPLASEKFQELGEAYGILSNNETRKIYDELGIEGMKKQQEQGGVGADIDPSEFFEVIFGGVAFKDWIGELGMFDDITKSAEVMGMDEENEETVGSIDGETLNSENGGKNSVNTTSTGTYNSTTSSNNTTTSSSKGKEDITSNLDSLTIAEKNNSPTTTSTSKHNLTTEELKRKRKQKITKEQRDEIIRIQEESRRKKKERINELSKKLMERIEKYRSSSLNPETFKKFTTQLHDEFDDMKIESFGIQLLQLIGKIYISQANATIASQKTFGVSKIFTSVKSSTETVKNGYSILKTALDAQDYMEKVMKEQEEFQLKQDLGYTPTQEEIAKQAEIERFVTGKFLATAWSLIKFEITGILNKVCQQILSEKGIGKKEKIARANAILFFGKEMISVKRSPEEEEDARIFEEMMGDAKMKKEKRKHKHSSGGRNEEH
ncbi:CAJ1 [Candida pseudojiufengensis]|uniref:CAJ1 n=1 Tax=Candida pseudojiufengensis TaxID=497109 RepID=UPI002223F253|nr:CAJ1 [Candida pseudojiufengensis]KAI5965909.1 CAJ1 [Candida pseudojiufengensis]